ncbi:MAG: hypothetical protein ACYDHY_10760 [Acidiferrobacterales bacterium]
MSRKTSQASATRSLLPRKDVLVVYPQISGESSVATWYAPRPRLASTPERNQIQDSRYFRNITRQGRVGRKPLHGGWQQMA